MRRVLIGFLAFLVAACDRSPDSLPCLPRGLITSNEANVAAIVFALSLETRSQADAEIAACKAVAYRRRLGAGS